MGVIAVLMSLLIPAVDSIMRGTALQSSGNKLAGYLELARQNAMAKNAMAGVLVVNVGVDKGKSFTIFEASPVSRGTPVWMAANKWERLPAGIVIDEEPFETSTAVVPDPDLPTITYKDSNGGSVSLAPRSSYNYIVFLPDGSILNTDKTSKVRLVEGVWNNGSLPTYNGRGNYYDIYVIPSTGRTKIDRP
jgi:Tfp pilus assembly protein FimT